MRRARKSVALRPSGRLLESRSDPGPRGMIAALRVRMFGCAATESGLQAHPPIYLPFKHLHRPSYDVTPVCRGIARAAAAQGLNTSPLLVILGKS